METQCYQSCANVNSWNNSRLSNNLALNGNYVMGTETRPFRGNLSGTSNLMRSTSTRATSSSSSRKTDSSARSMSTKTVRRAPAQSSMSVKSRDIHNEPNFDYSRLYSRIAQLENELKSIQDNIKNASLDDVNRTQLISNDVVSQLFDRVVSLEEDVLNLQDNENTSDGSLSKIRSDIDNKISQLEEQISLTQQEMEGNGAQELFNKFNELIEDMNIGAISSNLAKLNQSHPDLVNRVSSLEQKLNNTIMLPGGGTMIPYTLRSNVNIPSSNRYLPLSFNGILQNKLDMLSNPPSVSNVPYWRVPKDCKLANLTASVTHVYKLAANDINSIYTFEIYKANSYTQDPVDNDAPPSFVNVASLAVPVKIAQLSSGTQHSSNFIPLNVSIKQGDLIALIVSTSAVVSVETNPKEGAALTVTAGMMLM